MIKQFLFACSFFLGISMARANQDTLKIQSKATEANMISIAKTKSALNVSLSLKKEGISPSKKFDIKMKAGNKWRFVSTEEERSFYEYIVSAVANDSSHLDTITSYVKKHQQDSLILIQLMATAPSTPVTVDTASTLNGSPGTGDSIAPPKDNSILYLIIGILGGIIVGAGGYFIASRRKAKSSNLPPPDYRIPEELTSYFRIDKKTHPDKVVDLIIQKYYAAETTTTTEKTKAENAIAEKDKSISQLKEDVKKQKDIVAERDKTIENNEKNIQTLNEDLKKTNELLSGHKETGNLILGKFYTPMVQSLDNNSGTEPAAIKQLVLSNILATAFHSISYFRVLNNTHMNSDTLNLQKLKDEPVAPKGNVTFQSRFRDVEPLAYFVMELLKNEGVNSLDTVFIHGYKIGD